VVVLSTIVVLSVITVTAAVDEGEALVAGGLPECQKDSARECWYYQDKDFYCKQRWMILNCAHYCGHCAHPVVTRPQSRPAEVVDEIPVCYGSEHHLCGVYINSDKEYYCQQKWLRTNCQFMCGVCKY